MRSKYVAQCFVHGESLKTCLVAVVVPDFDVLPEAAKKQLGIEGKTMEELCRKQQVKAMVMEDIHEVGKKAGLFTFEQVSQFRNLNLNENKYNKNWFSGNFLFLVFILKEN